jgi:hypothetical protein
VTPKEQSSVQEKRTPTPDGYCHCGCGQKTELVKRTDKRHGIVAGEPKRFVRGHWNRLGKSPEYVIDVVTGCWVWQRSTRNGYGQVYYAGKQIGAHVAYYRQHKGDVPSGMQIDHLCRNRACVNPDHLEPVTPAENTRRGAKCDRVRPYVDLIRTSDEGAERLAAKLGVSANTVRRIRSGERWSERQAA